MWGRRLGIAGLVLVLLTGLGIVWLLDQVPRDDVEGVRPGRLTVAETALGEWQVGSVTVALGPTGLRLTDAARDGLVVWESPEERAFVVGVLGDVEVSEYRGYFWADTRNDCELTEQEVRSATDDGGRLQISGVLSGCGQKREYTIDVLEGPVVGDVQLSLTGTNVDALGIASARSSGAGVHGFGEQFAPFDLSGRVIPLMIREQGVGRGLAPLTFLADVTNRGAGGTESMTYAAWPSFVTGDVRGVELDPGEASSHAFAVADTRDDEVVTVTSWSDELTVRLTADRSPAALVQRRGTGTDRPMLPEWVFSGAVLGIQGGTDKVRQAVDDLAADGAELSAVWLQDWTGVRKAELGDRL